MLCYTIVLSSYCATLYLLLLFDVCYTRPVEGTTMKYITPYSTMLFYFVLYYTMCCCSILHYVCSITAATMPGPRRVEA